MTDPTAGALKAAGRVPKSSAMSAQLLPIFVVLGSFVLLAGAASWWHQRRYIQHLQALLVHNDQSRRALAEQLHALRVQLEAHQAQAQPDTEPVPLPDLEVRRAELERLLAASAVADGPWHDTQPVADAPAGR